MRLAAALFVTGMSVVAADVAADDYDPLRLSRDAAAVITDFTVNDSKRDRQIPIRVFLPSKDSITGAAPVAIFSHGLGGSREGSQFLGKHWGARGYVAVFVQHPGSDESVWKDVPIGKRTLCANND